MTEIRLKQSLNKLHNTMKKVLVFAIALFMAFSASAQIVSSSSRSVLKNNSTSSFKITAGYQQSSFTYEGLSISPNGFYAGLLYEVKSADYLMFGTGLLIDYSSKKIDILRSDISMATSYIRVPIHLGVNFDTGNGLEIFAKAGPGISFGVYGKDDLFGDNGLKRFDIQLGLEAGVRFLSKYEFRLGYDWGLLDQSENAKLHRNILHLGLAYCF